MVLGWSLFNSVPDSSALHSKWLLLPKIEISALLHIKMNSNFHCSYMAMNSSTYILGFSVRFFLPVYSVYEYYEINITSKSFAQKFEWKLSLGGPLSKLCVAPPFSLNFRCQIENQVSDYRLLGASSFKSSKTFMLRMKKMHVCHILEQEK